MKEAEEEEEQEKCRFIDFGPNELVDYRASLWVRPGMPRSAASGVAAHSASVPMGPTCTPSRYLPPPTLLPPPNFEC